jgi:hypothetical protein
MPVPPTSRLPQPQDAPPAGLGLFTGIPRTGFLDGDDRTSQVPGGPRYERALLFDPGGTTTLGHCRALVLSSAIWTASLPRFPHFEAQSHGPPTRCLRFAGWVTPPPRKTRFRRLANLTGRDWLPAGSQRKVSGHPILLSQALPGAPKSRPAVAGKRPGFAHQGADYVPVVDMGLPLVMQARQALHQPLVVVDLQMIGIQPYRDALADET